jgi:hypothetical protein
MRHGKREGVYKWFYCSRCRVWEKQRMEWNWAKEAQAPSPKQKILTTIITRKAISRPTLHRQHPDVSLNKVLRELEEEGAVEVQQSGFLGDNLHHEKLVVARAGVKQRILATEAT